MTRWRSIVRSTVALHVGLWWVAILCGAMAVCTPSARAACPMLTWSPPVPVFPAEAGRELLGFDVIQTPDRRLHAVWSWSDAAGDAPKLYWSVRSGSEPHGWSAPQRMDPLGTALVEGGPLLSVATDGTMALAFWRSTSTTTAPATTWMATLPLGAEEWDRPHALVGVPASGGTVGLAAVTADSLWVFAVDTTQLRGWPVIAGQVGPPVAMPAGGSWAFEEIWSPARAARMRAGEILVWWSDSAYGGLASEIAYTWLTASGFGEVRLLMDGFGPWRGQVVENIESRSWLAFDAPSDVGGISSVAVAERQGASWHEAVVLAGGDPPSQPSSGCLGASIGLLDGGRPLVVYSCEFPGPAPAVRLYGSAFGGMTWCPPQPLWPAPTVDLVWHPDTDVVTRAGMDPLLAFSRWQSGELMITEVIQSVVVAPDSTDDRPAALATAAGAALTVSYFAPREVRFCRGSAAGPLAVELFDLAGRRVATLHELEDAAATCAAWRALDAEGRPVAAGTYLYRARELGAPQRVAAAGKLVVWAH